LGGGLALSVSVHHGVTAITFDPSPRIFDGLGDMHEPALRVCVYQDGEILEKVRSHWNKFSDVVAEENIYKCKYDFGGHSNHKSDILALRILEQAAPADPKLKLLLQSTNRA
jgi:hypothetical protein